MKKLIVFIQMAFVSLLFSNALHAQSKLDSGISKLKNEDKTSKETLLKAYSITHDYAKKLRGIEYYFVEIAKNKPKVTFEKIRLLMIYNKASIPSEVEKHYSELENPNYPYKINLLDKRSGYLKLNCIGCENTTFMTYWNVKDGSKLIGVVNRGCGPVCEDDVSFFKYKKNKLSSIPRYNVIPNIKKSEFRNNVKFVVPPVFKGMTPSEFENMEPWEVTYNLPRSGKTILVSFDLSSEKYFTGNCMKLLWQDGRFARTPVSYCKHKPN